MCRMTFLSSVIAGALAACIQPGARSGHASTASASCATVCAKDGVSCTLSVAASAEAVVPTLRITFRNDGPADLTVDTQLVFGVEVTFVGAGGHVVQLVCDRRRQQAVTGEAVGGRLTRLRPGESLTRIIHPLDGVVQFEWSTPFLFGEGGVRVHGPPSGYEATYRLPRERQWSDIVEIRVTYDVTRRDFRRALARYLGPQGGAASLTNVTGFAGLRLRAN